MFLAKWNNISPTSLTAPNSRDDHRWRVTTDWRISYKTWRQNGKMVKQTQKRDTNQLRSIFHQPRFPWNSRGCPFGGNRSCEVAIIWPDNVCLGRYLYLYFGLSPFPVYVWKWRFSSGSPTKNIRILVVTGILGGGTAQFILFTLKNSD